MCSWNHREVGETRAHECYARKPGDGERRKQRTDHGISQAVEWHLDFIPGRILWQVLLVILLYSLSSHYSHTSQTL